MNQQSLSTLENAGKNINSTNMADSQRNTRCGLRWVEEAHATGTSVGEKEGVPCLEERAKVRVRQDESTRLRVLQEIFCRRSRLPAAVLVSNCSSLGCSSDSDDSGHNLQRGALQASSPLAALYLLAELAILMANVTISARALISSVFFFAERITSRHT
jgi:hypothetical protein